MKLRTIAIDDTLVAAWLDEFKTFAAVPDDSTDTMLESALRVALLKVQEYADTAVAQTTLELTAEPDDSGKLRLYMASGCEILTLTDVDGAALSYTDAGEGTLQLSYGGTVKCRYQTMPEPGDTDRLKLTVFRYALAVYDGETTDTLNGILNETIA